MTKPDHILPLYPLISDVESQKSGISKIQVVPKLVLVYSPTILVVLYNVINCVIQQTARIGHKNQEKFDSRKFSPQIDNHPIKLEYNLKFKQLHCNCCSKII